MAHGFSCSAACGIFRIRDRPQVSCGRQADVAAGATGEAPPSFQVKCRWLSTPARLPRSAVPRRTHGVPSSRSSRHAHHRMLKTVVRAARRRSPRALDGQLEACFAGPSLWRATHACEAARAFSFFCSDGASSSALGPGLSHSAALVPCHCWGRRVSLLRLRAVLTLTRLPASEEPRLAAVASTLMHLNPPEALCPTLLSELFCFTPFLMPAGSVIRSLCSLRLLAPPWPSA